MIDASNTVLTRIGQGNGAFTAGTSYPQTSPLAAIAAADIDGDGQVDLLLGRSTGVAILPGNGSGGFTTADVYPIGIPAAQSSPEISTATAGSTWWWPVARRTT